MLSRPAPWSLDHPLWLCGFRPFFLFALASAPLLVVLWGGFLAWGLPLPAVPGGPFVWHAHELLFGFGLAAVAGFALTAVPEFTDTPAIDARTTRRLTAAWLAGRVAFWSSGVAGEPALVVSALAHLGLLAGLVAVLGPRLWRDPERRHLAFLWALVVLGALLAGFYADALRGMHPVRWLHATLGVLMILVIVAMSRISMRIVNAAIEQAGVAGVEYRARPPRRNLAMLCIGLYTVAVFSDPGGRIGGWLALAAAAAILNLGNDWHVGRALFRRWPLMLYAVYLLMAGGYGLIGFALVGSGEGASAGLHVLTVGALGLGVFVVICIAGRSHCGLPLDERPWVPAGALLLVAAASARAAAAWAGADALIWMGAAVVAWAVAFVLGLGRLGPLFIRPRADGRSGCAGPG